LFGFRQSSLSEQSAANVTEALGLDIHLPDVRRQGHHAADISAVNQTERVPEFV